VKALEGIEVVDIDCGGGHTAAITSSGELYLWGRGRDGQLGREGHIESIAAARTTPILVDALAPGSVSKVFRCNQFLRVLSCSVLMNCRIFLF